MGKTRKVDISFANLAKVRERKNNKLKGKKMKDVLSTKVTAEERGRFTARAKQQGETTSGLLRKLALNHINGVAKVTGVASVGNSHPAAPSKKDLVKEAKHVDSLPSSTKSLPINQGASEGRPETRSKFSIAKVLLVAASIFLLWSKSQPSKTTDDQPVFDSSSPYFDAYGKCIYPTG